MSAPEYKRLSMQTGDLIGEKGTLRMVVACDHEAKTFKTEPFPDTHYDQRADGGFAGEYAGAPIADGWTEVT